MDHALKMVKQTVKIFSKNKNENDKKENQIKRNNKKNTETEERDVEVIVIAEEGKENGEGT